MISATDAYKAAIVGNDRRTLLRALMELIDPDIVYGGIESNGEAPWSKRDQLYDKVFEIDSRYATLERGRWLLDGSFSLIPDDPTQLPGNTGFVGDALCGDDGVFATPPWIELRFENVSILQACSVFFSTDFVDGIPVDFTVEVKQGGVAYYTKTYTDNTETSVYLDSFTVHYPDAIRVTVTKWSLPSRRMRAIEIVPGIYEKWDGRVITSFSLKHQGDVSCLSLPYGTCSIKIDNQNRRFEPRNKSGLFKSIEDRQGIPISIGVRLPDDTDEYIPVGVFHQYSGGWKMGDNSLTMQWDLVDIIGLLVDREYIPGDTLPTTLGGWAAALVAQLGVNFEERYTVDPNYADLPVSVREAADITGMKCGDILRFVCMATGTWPRADAETGYLAIEPLWNQGNKVTLDNLESYPVMKANKDVAAIIFTLNDGADTKYVVSGTTTASGETQSIDNPFIQTPAQALTAARAILSTFGGNMIELTGRGDMISEIGDVDTIWLNESTSTTARRIQQDLSLSGGALKGCKTTLLQADGSFLFESREVVTRSGTWTAPSGVTRIRFIAVGGGAGGEKGTDGGWGVAGVNGANGLGANVYALTIDINDGQTFDVTIGEGGGPAEEGTDTVFGQYSSANGEFFEYGYTDIANGVTYARSGVAKPLADSGDGGAGGKGGIAGRYREVTKTVDGETITTTVIDNYPTPGEEGAPGASGCVVIYYEAAT